MTIELQLPGRARRRPPDRDRVGAAGRSVTGRVVRRRSTRVLPGPTQFGDRGPPRRVGRRHVRGLRGAPGARPPHRSPVAGAGPGGPPTPASRRCWSWPTPTVGDGTLGMAVRRHRDAELWASTHTDDLVHRRPPSVPRRPSCTSTRHSAGWGRHRAGPTRWSATGSGPAPTRGRCWWRASSPAPRTRRCWRGRSGPGERARRADHDRSAVDRRQRGGDAAGRSGSTRGARPRRAPGRPVVAGPARAHGQRRRVLAPSRRQRRCRLPTGIPSATPTSVAWRGATPTGSPSSRFALDGVLHELTPNEGPHHLHGGPVGFDRRDWAMATDQDDLGAEVRLRLDSEAGDQGYPGAVRGRGEVPAGRCRASSASPSRRPPTRRRCST